MRHVRRRLAIWTLLLILSLSLAMVCCTETAWGQTTSWPALIQAAKPAVVWILAETSEGTAAGSGAIISPDGYILTAAHVVTGASSITVVVNESDEYRASVVRSDAAMDVAVLKIPGSGLTWLGLGDSDQVAIEDEVRVLGYPLPGAGVGYIAVAGIIQGTRDRDGVTLLQHNASTAGGHSGGPVLNSQGQVIGVHSAVLTDQPEYHLAISVNDAKTLVPYGVLPSSPSPVQPATGAVAAATVVRVPQDQPTLAAAVRVATAGGEIQVASGIYSGDVSITKSVAISGTGSPVLQGTLRVSAAENVTITGIEVTGRVEIRDSASFTLDRVSVRHSAADGMLIEASAGVIAGCTIEAAAGSGIVSSFGTRVSIITTVVRASGNAGIAISLNSQARISETIVERSGTDGVKVSSSTVDVSDSQIAENSGFGIDVDASGLVSGGGNRGWANALGAGSPGVADAIVPVLRVSQDLPLTAALQKVPSGSTGTIIVIPSGTHEGSWTVNASLTLRASASAQQLVLIKGSQDASHVLEVVGAAVVRFEDVSVTGGSDAALLVTDSAHVTLSGCEIFGSGGSGIEVHGSAAALLVSGGSIIGNGADGLLLVSAALVSIADCRIAENERCGVNAEHLAAATIEMTGCTLAGNGASGVAAGDSSTLTMQTCTLSGNGRSGDCDSSDGCPDWLSTTRERLSALVLTGGVTATVDATTVSDNSWDGIWVADQGRLTLSRSEVCRNGTYGDGWEGGCGILCLDSAELLARSALIQANTRDGMYIAGQATAHVSDTSVTQSSMNGITITESAQVDISNSRISSNALRCVGCAGIEFIGSGTLMVTVSEIADNGYYGMTLDPEGGIVTVDHCTLSRNVQAGIHAYSWAAGGRVEIDDSSFIDHPRYAVEDEAGSSTPVLVWHGRGNAFKGNGADVNASILLGLRLPLSTETARAEVSVPGDYPTIQAAIDAVAPQGTVVLSAGVYDECVLVWKPVTVKGEGSAATEVRALPGRSVGITILDVIGEVALEGLRVTGSSGVGVTVRGGGVLIDGIAILGSGSHGLLVEGGALVTVIGSHFADNTGCGITKGGRTPEIAGERNTFSDNGCALGPGIDVGVMSPLVEQTDRLTVAVPGDYLSIQEAVDAVSPGGTVFVGPGLHLGGLTIGKPLTLRGSGLEATTIRTSASDAAAGVTILESARVVSLEQMSISGTDQGTGVVVRGGMVTARSLSISRYGVNVLVQGSGSILLEGCSVLAARQGGLVAYDSSDVLLRDCTFTNNRFWAVRAEDDARLTMEGTSLRGSGLSGVGGISVISLSDNVSAEISASNLEDNDTSTAIWINGGASVTLQDCRVTRNKGDGVSVSGSAHLSILRSVISANGGETWSGSHGCGLGVFDTAVVEGVDVVISGHPESGIELFDGASLRLDRSHVELNGRFGVSIPAYDCGEWNSSADGFTGSIAGNGNSIPGSGEASANSLGSLCPTYPGSPWPAGFLSE